MTTGRLVLEAFAGLVQSALPDTSIDYEAIGESQIPADLREPPKSYTVLLLDAGTAERLDWRQTRQDVAISGYLYAPRGDDRRTVQDSLDAIRTALEADEQLSQTVRRSQFDSDVVESHIDTDSFIGLFDYTGELLKMSKTTPLSPTFTPVTAPQGVLTEDQETALATVQATIGGAIDTDTSVSAAALPGSGAHSRDYYIAEDTTVFALDDRHVLGWLPAGSQVQDSNIRQIVLGQTYEVAHRLGDPFDERPYTGQPDVTTLAVLDRDIATLTDRQWWRGISGVSEVLSEPERGEIQRTGDVIHYQVQVQVLVDLPQT